MRQVPTALVAVWTGLAAFAAHAETPCFQIRTNVSYCSDALMLGHVPPDSTEAVSTPVMPHVRAFFYDETETMTSVIIADIPVTVSGDAPLTLNELMFVALENAEANTFLPFEHVDVRVGPDKLGPWDGMVGQFTSLRSETGEARASAVLNAFSSEGKVLMIMTLSDFPQVTDELWAIHSDNMSRMKVSP